MSEITALVKTTNISQTHADKLAYPPSQPVFSTNGLNATLHTEGLTRMPPSMADFLPECRHG